VIQKRSVSAAQLDEDILKKNIVLTVYVGFFAGAKFRDFFLALLNFDDP
jgi:hypothetical protein